MKVFGAASPRSAQPSCSSDLAFKRFPSTCELEVATQGAKQKNETFYKGYGPEIASRNSVSYETGQLESSWKQPPCRGAETPASSPSILQVIGTFEGRAQQGNLSLEGSYMIHPQPLGQLAPFATTVFAHGSHLRLQLLRESLRLGPRTWPCCSS